MNRLYDSLQRQRHSSMLLNHKITLELFRFSWKKKWIQWIFCWRTTTHFFFLFDSFQFRMFLFFQINNLNDKIIFPRNNRKNTNNTNSIRFIQCDINHSATFECWTLSIWLSYKMHKSVCNSIVEMFNLVNAVIYIPSSSPQYFGLTAHKRAFTIQLRKWKYINIINTNKFRIVRSLFVIE